MADYKTPATNERWTIEPYREGEMILRGEVDVYGLDGASWIIFFRQYAGLDADQLAATLLDVRGYALAYWRQHADLSALEPQP